MNEQINTLSFEKNQIQMRNKSTRMNFEIQIQRLEEENTELHQEKDLIEEGKQKLQEEKSSMESQMDNQIQQLQQEKNDMEHENQQLREVNSEKDNVILAQKENSRKLSNDIRRLRQKKDAESSIFTERGTVTFSTDDILERGGWAAVYTGDYYGTKVAVKEFQEVILSPHNRRVLEREIKIASQCRHPNLLQMICATENEKNCLVIVTELMDMTLRTLLEQRANNNSRLEPSQVESISLDVARGLNYLHLKKPNPVIHRDVSSANVLLWMENGSVRRAKISDYGSANFMQACNTENPGAPLYATSEAKGNHYSPKIDVFSYGLLVCEMSICELPHPEQTERNDQIERISNYEVKRLVGDCTVLDPQKRPTMQDIIEFWQSIDTYRTAKARSLALRFTDINPCCVRAIPYENDDKAAQQKSFIMCLYVDNGNKGVPDDLKQAASEMFADYEIEYVDLQRRPLPEIATRLPASKRVKHKELRDLSKIIERNLHVFENKLNVTAVQASYKVVNFSEKDIPCVTVFVLGKRRIPVGETDLKKLDNNPFDVDIDIVEGYFQPCSDNYESYAYPLLGGVSIGIDEDKSRAGTLGGFLKDENGKRYILSCEHVLNPDENDNCNNEIVQPAEIDFNKALHDASSSVSSWSSKLERQEENMKKLAGDERRRYDENRTRKTRKVLDEMRKKQLNVASNKPRSIGKYICGLKQNEEVQITNNNRANVYVDAAIAELSDEEAEEIQVEKNDEPENDCCPLFGFKNNKEKAFEPTGYIVDLHEFDCHHDLRLMKIGRTTGLTDDGEFETTNFFLNSTGYKKNICAGNLYRIPYILYCNSCEPLTKENQVEMSCITKPCCAKCKKEIENNITAFWAHNCMAIRKRNERFCKKGDSGALVFDSQGRVWGMIFGVFSAESIFNFEFGLATPLSVALQALGRIS